MIELLTAMLVIITAFYAWATYRILQANKEVVEEMRSQAEAMARPYVTVNTILVPSSSIIYLRISNIGRTSANGLRLEMDRDFYSYGEVRPDRNVARHNAFQETIPSFAPGAELIFALAQGFVIFGEEADPSKTPPAFVVKATYSYGHKTVRESTTVDLRPVLRSAPNPEPAIDRLKEIRESIDKVEKAIQQTAHNQAMQADTR